MRASSLLLAFFLTASPAFAELRVASVFADHMVVQVGEPVPLWGWADPGAQVVVQFDGIATGEATANESGAWRAVVPAPDPGPDAFAAHRVTVSSGDETLAIEDVLLGEVWLASGQSNMEMGLNRTDSWDEALAAAPYPGLRMFTVQRSSLPEAPEDVEGSWARAEGDNLGNFSAAGLHFGLDLIQELGRPVGIVHSSWGGSSVQAWMSPDVLLALPGDPGGYQAHAEARKQQESNRAKYSGEVLAGDDVDGWETCTVPVDFEDLVPNYDGAIWFRKTVRIPGPWTQEIASLSLGAIDDADEVWIDGIRVGGTSNHQAKRLYSLNERARVALSDGVAQIAIRVMDTGGWGGFSDAADQIAFLDIKGSPLELAGDWQWKRGAAAYSTAANHAHSHLYNGMIEPLIGLPLAGCIWYQGESNASDPAGYGELFPAMIQAWRRQLGIPELPFYWVQLTSFGAGSGSDWPGLREAQRRTLDRVPHSGMAVIIDVGDERDIHPRNKHAVGSRLARLALYGAYGRNGESGPLVVPSGPMAQSAKLDGCTAMVSFESFGSALMVREPDTKLGGFEIAGPDGIWHAADAKIESGQVRLASEFVAEPKEVRYAWSNVPSDANLVQSDGLPASPFHLEL